MSKVIKIKNASKRLKVVGSYLGLAFLVFATVTLLAASEKSGNWLYLMASLGVLALFLWLTVQVHFRHRNTDYGLESLR